MLTKRHIMIWFKQPTCRGRLKDNVFIVSRTKNICRGNIVLLRRLSVLRRSLRFTTRLHFGICRSCIALLFVCNLELIRAGSYVECDPIIPSSICRIPRGQARLAPS